MNVYPYFRDNSLQEQPLLRALGYLLLDTFISP
nr:MAG TPA: hypothetical protein [Caudoviricetes sp.]